MFILIVNYLLNEYFFVFYSENEKKCTLDQAFRGVLEEEIVSISSPLFVV